MRTVHWRCPQASTLEAHREGAKGFYLSEQDFTRLYIEADQDLSAWEGWHPSGPSVGAPHLVGIFWRIPVFVRSNIPTGTVLVEGLSELPTRYERVLEDFDEPGSFPGSSLVHPGVSDGDGT